MIWAALFFGGAMKEQQAQGLGFWLNLYIILSIIVGLGLFMFALIGYKNLSTGPDGLGWIVFLFFATAFISFFLVYRLLSINTPMTIYLVRSFETLSIVLTLFAMPLASLETMLYLLARVAWLVFFFRSKKVKTSYFATTLT